MSAETLKARKQLAEVGMLLKQGKLLAAVTGMHEAVGTVLKTPLMKREMQEYSEALDKAAYMLGADRELKKIYPVQIRYTPGAEQEFLAALGELQTFLRENLAEEADTRLEALKLYRQKQLELIRQALRRDDPEEAGQTASRLTEENPEDTELRAALADIFLEAGRCEEALSHLRAAYPQDQDYAHALNRLGMTLRKAGRLDEAEKFYLRALERESRDESIHFNLGRVYLDMKAWERAARAAADALNINPDFDEARKMKLFADRQART